MYIILRYVYSGFGFLRRAEKEREKGAAGLLGKLADSEVLIDSGKLVESICSFSLSLFHVEMRSGRTGSSRFGAPRSTCTLTRTLPKLTFGRHDPSGGILNKSRQIRPLASSTFGCATGVTKRTIGGSNGYLKESRLISKYILLRLPLCKFHF